MSEDSKPYLFSALKEQDQATGCSSMASLHRIGGFAEGGELGLASEGSDSSSQDHSASPHSDQKMAESMHEDVEIKSSGSSGSGTESHGNESHGNESHGNESTGSSNGNSKDSALLESSGSNKSSNSHSPSPPSSSNAFSLLSASSEQDNPSTSGCSSEESAKAKTQKELIKTLKELKLHLPAEKRNKGSKSTTLNTLKYALRCVKQVEANEEYYQLLMINDSQPSGLDVSSYTIDEIDSITSEYTLKNTDIFAVAVSLITGKIVYISDQAASILNCKRDVFKNAKFVEFLTPQDVSVFYSFTTPYRLPSWSMCTGAESSPSDCMQEKSFFCRISGGKECEGDLQYYPFRMTPYRMKVQDTVHTEDQFCCLLLAERVHSGYEAPRIPTDKRIFTTTHTPNCVFQDVDERAVPLLGYLPQDLIGTPVLLHLHPKDRPIMLGIHRKILQYAGQPFDHSSIRFCTRNGEYITIDTSWSSFVNPWSRKVSFVIGRHKVRMGPVNEDVFAAPPTAEGKVMDSDIQEITEQIHRLLLQPVHNNGSSGYGSLGSNDHLMSVASSSESNGNGTRPHFEDEENSRAKPRTFQEICKGVHMQKNQEQQTRKAPGKSLQKSPAVRPKDSAYPTTWRENEEAQQAPVQEELTFKDQTVYSYQQISCLDSVIRYLESCNVPITVKRKCQSSSNTTSSNSDEDKQKAAERSMQVSEDSSHLKSQAGLTSLDVSKKPGGSGVVSTSLTPLALPSKAESVVSITSQCSYSSTIVHVGDKKPQPESEIIEDGPGAGDTGDGPAVAVTPATVSPPSQEREAYKKLGLTKQVLAAHTQNEEQAFLNRFRELRGVHAFKADCSHYLERQRGQVTSDAVPTRVAKQGGVTEPVARRGSRNKKTKSKRIKQNESSDSTISHRKQLSRQELQGLNQTSWSPSETSQSTYPMAYPAVMPAYPLQVYPGTNTMAPRVDASLSGFGGSQCSQDPRCPIQPIQAPFSAPLVTPMVALVLPNYMFPQIGSTPRQPFYPEQGTFAAQPSFPPQTVFPPQTSFQPQTTVQFPVQTQFTTQNPFPPPTTFPTQPFQFPLPNDPPKPMEPELREAQSRSSTPQSMGGRDQPSPPLFQSRCSSPLQLNLLQLEESQRSMERQDSSAPSTGAQGNTSTAAEKTLAKTDKEQRSLILPGPVGTNYGPGTLLVLPLPGPELFGDQEKDGEFFSWDRFISKLRCPSEEDEGSTADSHHCDALSSSSDMLDILLLEDSRSGTGSATSGSMGSGSNGCGTSACGTSASGGSASGTGSSHTSNNSSNYFGSVDSSQKSHKANGGVSGSMEMEESESLIKYELQDPLWLLTANVDKTVMMTYQLPSRDFQRVLREDREKLRHMQKSQPRFSEEQKKELAEVHPWLRRGGLPKSIDVKACVGCEGVTEMLIEEELPDLHMGESEHSDVTVPPSNHEQ
ncbi:period circadian protein homolog 2 isoform X2 [Astyanax mexicanus]|uniref:period circadian protein homolog 2 isoform X2 n=1 Tax=Astyanax mexicanus TaxID=7994 RepID=UPI0020CB0679|nr:period circadian protein homolog 2 isoform X2 [Astyanax mexicanus]